MIRPVQLSDAEPISSIYNEYVANSRSTFEENPVTVDEMNARIQKITKNYPWLVYEMDGKVIGYTYATKWKERSAYRYTVETGIYLDSNHLGKGVGSSLKGAMINELREKSFHSVISGIALPNPASIAMCEKFGFEKIAHFKEVGFKLNKWVDVGYWQLIL
jgi:phosphinothricin acetyltransferase